MRGIVHKNLSDHMERGITPAYAGNRPLPSESLRRTQDYPCVCGE